MNRLSCFVIVSTLFSAPAFAADAPTLVNQDAAYYGITLDCPGSEAGEQIHPGETLTLDGYKLGCKLVLENADTGKVLQSVKLKKSSECWIKAGKVHCQ